ncbi:hypothetical protein SBA2_200005 [Acidobacteriia bacterium SbA2]|nr:hypothetical protein SBA2_200005 [Acidobacteriia bacterium SbA2]
MLVLESGDRDGGWMLRRVSLDRLPGRRIRYPSPRRGLLRCQLGQFVGFGNTTRVDLANAQPLARRFHPNPGGAGERHIDRPYGGAARSVTPEECRGCDLRREDRAFLGVVDRNRDQLRTVRVGRQRRTHGVRTCQLLRKRQTCRARAVLRGVPPQNYCGGSSHKADDQTSGSPLFHSIRLIQPDDSRAADLALQFGLFYLPRIKVSRYHIAPRCEFANSTAGAALLGQFYRVLPGWDIEFRATLAHPNLLRHLSV